MFGRGSLFIAVLIAAFAVPYALSERTNSPDQSQFANGPTSQVVRNGWQRWWDSMWTDSIDGPRRGLPIASASPLPGGRSSFGQQPYRPSTGNSSYPVQRAPAAGSSGVSSARYGTVQPYPGGSPMHAAPTPGQPSVMATPWVPVNPQMPTSAAWPQQQTGVAQIPQGAAAGPWTPVSGGAPGFPQTGAAAAPSANLAQYLGFDVTPSWVMQNWDRVSTEVWRDNLEGMRVAFVSGTRADDLAGSLTYYFDRQQVLQRIAFQGSTGSESHVQQLAQELGLQSQPSYGGSTLIRETEEGIVTDLVRVRPMSGRARSPFQRFAVQLELNRPGNGQSVSEPLLEQLRSSTSLPSLKTRSLTEALRQQAALEATPSSEQLGMPPQLPTQQFDGLPPGSPNPNMPAP